VRTRLLRSPLQLHSNEVGNILRCDAAFGELREHEELLIVQTAQLRLFLRGDRIEAAPPQSFGDCSREHLVEQQLHP
jgi:transcriptional antiterminator Rof (Rho-off)